MDGKTVRAIRWEHDLTQQSLADIIGVSRQLIEAIESGRTSVSRRTAFKLGQHFDIEKSLSSFFTHREKMSNIAHYKHYHE